jgi:hypothetical protein
MVNEIIAEIISDLKIISVRIKSLEEEASDLLDQQGDKEEYAAKLREKTDLLVMLPALVEVNRSHLPTSVKSLIKDKLGGMAFSAEKAIQLDSIFYMSALLYPEDYQNGDLNDLESFINLLYQVKDERTV